jgi:predicted nucleic acid-binding protein
MPVLNYLADTNIVSDYFRPGNPVKGWFDAHRDEVGISTLTLAEIRDQPLPYGDSLIAAIARSVGLTVVTSNEKHSPGVRTVNPWKL